MDKNKMADRIAKILNKAERAGTDEEAEEFFRKAAELQERHEIEESMIDAKRGVLGQGKNPITSRVFRATGTYAMTCVQLATSIARGLGLRAVYTHTKQGGEVTMTTVIGHTRDLNRCEVLYTSLLSQRESSTRRHMVRWKKQNDDATAREKYQARRGYMLGYCEGVHMLLDEIRRRAMNEIPGAGLVLADKSTAVDEAFEDMFPDTDEQKLDPVDRASFIAGYFDGKKADADETRLATDRRRALR